MVLDIPDLSPINPYVEEGRNQTNTTLSIEIEIFFAVASHNVRLPALSGGFLLIGVVKNIRPLFAGSFYRLFMPPLFNFFWIAT